MRRSAASCCGPARRSRAWSCRCPSELPGAAPAERTAASAAFLRGQHAEASALHAGRVEHVPCSPPSLEQRTARPFLFIPCVDGRFLSSIFVLQRRALFSMMNREIPSAQHLLSIRPSRSDDHQTYCALQKAVGWKSFRQAVPAAAARFERSLVLNIWY